MDTPATGPDEPPLDPTLLLSVPPQLPEHRGAAEPISASDAETSSALILGTIPLGGAGAGSVEVSADSRFRHISINNNRATSAWIPASPNSFIAVRFAPEGGKPVCYILQRQSSSQDTDLIPMPRIPKGDFSSRGIYPMLHFRAHGDDLRFNAVWMLMSPMIPFDLEASVLPMLLASVQVRNRRKVPAVVSVLFHLEHLCGRSGEMPVTPRPISARYIEEDEGAPPPADARAAQAHNALVFESGGPIVNDADGQHCLAVRTSRGGVPSVGAYNASDPARNAEFWRHFQETGDVPTGLLGAQAEYGAVCLKFEVPPKEDRCADFAWSWYAPQFRAPDGEQMGNGYTCLEEDAIEVARRGLKHGGYYCKSVLDWQQRFNSSSLPRWLIKELINSARIFTRNGLYAEDGRFGLQASPLDSRVGDVPGRLYASLGTLMFLPRFEEEELSLAIRARDIDQPERLCHVLGNASLHHPEAVHEEWEQMIIAASLVISTYRNHLFTGSLVHARKRFPLLREIMNKMFQLDLDGDGFPEGRAPHASLRQSARDCGLWLLALRCYALLAHEREAPGEAGRAEALFARAQTNFDRHFWDPELKQYRLWRRDAEPDDESCGEVRCHLGMLAGEWQAALLGLGPLHATERINGTLDAITFRLDEDISSASPNVFADPDGVNRVLAHAGCLLIQRDRAGMGLRLIERLLARAEQVYGASRRQRSSALAIWHVLQSIHGVTLNAGRNQLRITPRLPPGVAVLSTPVFTPGGLCWMKLRIDAGAIFRQQVHFSFDSPTTIATVLMRVPPSATKVRAITEMPDGAIPCTAELLPGEYYRLALIVLERPVHASSAFSIDLVAE